jgi:LEA14-like dessication related protein
MRALRPAAALVLVAALAACAQLESVARSALQRPTLSFQSASLRSLDLEGATVAFEYRVDNPNGFGLDLASLGYRLDLEGRRVVDGTMDSGLRIPASGSAPLSFPVHVRFADVPGFVDLVKARDAVKYRLAGTAGLRTPVGVVDLPLAHEGSIPLPDLPDFALDGISIRSASFTDVVLDVKLRVRNGNAFALPRGALSYGLSVAGAAVASADGKDLAPVAANSSAVLAIPVRVSLAGAGRAVTGLVQGEAVDVALTGNARFAGVGVPLDLRARLRASR